MNQANNATDSDDALHVGLIADGEGVLSVGPTLADPALRVVAQSGMRPDNGLPDIEWYDDARVMIAQSGAEALILAASTRDAVELSQMAMDHGCPVWRLPPLARNFAEATELALRLRQQTTPYRVASWWEAVAEDVRWALRWREGFRPLFTETRISTPGPSFQSWRASLADAPGGVLATDGYALLEALVAVRKLPERVMASIAQVRRRTGEAPRETEGVVNAILRYENGATATVQATWDIPPFGRITAHHGAELTVTIEPRRVAIYGRDGELSQQRRLSAKPFPGSEMAQFVAAVRDPETSPSQDPTIERHIAVTALLQAIYLSARTGQPESPRKFYEVQSWPEPRW